MALQVAVPGWVVCGRTDNTFLGFHAGWTQSGQMWSKNDVDRQTISL
jgi:hypothetical protein